MYSVRSTRRAWILLPTTLGLVTFAVATAASALTADPLPSRFVDALPDSGGAATTPPAAPPAAPRPVMTIDELRRALAAGDDIFIVRKNGAATTGRVLRIGVNELDVRPRAARATRPALDLTIPLDEIRVLERPRDSSSNGALIGAGVGAAVTLGLFAYAVAVDRNEMDEWAAGYMVLGGVFAGVGALVGWAIDTAHSKPAFRYQARTDGGATVRLAPTLSRAPGVAVILSY